MKCKQNGNDISIICKSDIAQIKLKCQQGIWRAEAQCYANKMGIIEYISYKKKFFFQEIKLKCQQGSWRAEAQCRESCFLFSAPRFSLSSPLPPGKTSCKF